MQLLSVLNNKFKISFNPSKYDIATGALFKLISSESNKVIAQVVNIETSSEGEYIATLKALFTEKNSAWHIWSGNIPAKNCIIKPVGKEVFQSLLAQNEDRIINIGYIPTYDTDLNLNLSSLKNVFVLYDSLQDKKDFISKIQNEFASKNEELVILDFKNDIAASRKITASQDFRIPLNVTNLNNIYQKNMKEASVESKAVVEDVIFQVKNYLKSIGEDFIAFNTFKAILDEEASETAELLLLKNALAKYEEENIFADTKKEFLYIKNLLSRALISVVDFSALNTEWKKEYLLFVLQNLEDTNILLETDSDWFDEEIKQFLLIKKPNLKVFALCDYKSPSARLAVDSAQNLILYSKTNTVIDMPAMFKEYIKFLYAKEFLFYGEQSKNIPIVAASTNNSIAIEIPQEELIYEEENAVDLIDETEEPVSSGFIYENEKVEDILSEIDAVSNANAQIAQEPLNLAETDPTISVIQNEFAQANEKLSAQGQIITEESQESVEANEDINDDDYELLDYNDFQEENDDDLFEKELTKDVDKLYIANPEVIAPPQVEEKEEVTTEGNIPVYNVKTPQNNDTIEYSEGEKVMHPKYGEGTVQKIISYGDKKLLSINFEEIGRRLLDPNLAELKKV